MDLIITFSAPIELTAFLIDKLIFKNGEKELHIDYQDISTKMNKVNNKIILESELTNFDEEYFNDMNPGETISPEILANMYLKNIEYEAYVGREVINIRVEDILVKTKEGKLSVNINK